MAPPVSVPSRWPRHLAVALLGALVTALFWRSRLEWDGEMRLWRAFGDASFALLALALLVGPLAILWPRSAPLLAWRRALGIWSALLALVHAYLVWDGWARWSFLRLLGYEFLQDYEEPVLTMPGFGLSNLVGLAALAIVVLLAAISSERAIAALGARAWKHLQRSASAAFYLVGLHGLYFLFMHYDLSLPNLVLRKAMTPPNWFAGWFVGALLLVASAQVAAFWRTVRARPGARTMAEPVASTRPEKE